MGGPCNGALVSRDSLRLDAKRLIPLTDRIKIPIIPNYPYSSVEEYLQKSKEIKEYEKQVKKAQRREKLLEQYGIPDAELDGYLLALKTERKRLGGPLAKKWIVFETMKEKWQDSGYKKLYIAAAKARPVYPTLSDEELLNVVGKEIELAQGVVIDNDTDEDSSRAGYNGGMENGSKTDIDFSSSSNISTTESTRPRPVASGEKLAAKREAARLKRQEARARISAAKEAQEKFKQNILKDLSDYRIRRYKAMVRKIQHVKARVARGLSKDTKIMDLLGPQLWFEEKMRHRNFLEDVPPDDKWTEKTLRVIWKNTTYTQEDIDFIDSAAPEEIDLDDTRIIEERRVAREMRQNGTYWKQWLAKQMEKRKDARIAASITEPDEVEKYYEEGEDGYFYNYPLRSDYNNYMCELHNPPEVLPHSTLLVFDDKGNCQEMSEPDYRLYEKRTAHYNKNVGMIKIA